VEKPTGNRIMGKNCTGVYHLCHIDCIKTRDARDSYLYNKEY